MRNTRRGFNKFRQAGFSLIEMMVTVAIIGILAVVAVPNFEGYLVKTQLNHAKALLTSYYVAQKAAHAEYQYYPGNFNGAGFRPEGRMQFRIYGGENAGVSDAHAAAMGNLSDTTTTACWQTNHACPAGYKQWSEQFGDINTLTEISFRSYIGTSGSTFRAGALGRPYGQLIACYLDQTKAFDCQIYGDIASPILTPPPDNSI